MNGPLDPHALSVAIRWLHVAAMALAFGGAVLLAIAARSPRRIDGLLEIASSYERTFWLAAGVLVMTGVGNAAAFGVQLPAPDTRWGVTFLVKLLGVGGLMLLSAPRTVAVAHLAVEALDAHAASVLARLYGATAILLIAILAAAVWLAHG
jgi:hypothetical protein